MSRPRYYWYGYIVQTIRRKKILSTDRPKEAEALQAIEDAITETAEGDNGIARVDLVKMLYIDHTHTIDGAAMALYISTSTAKRWARDFVYLTAEKMGFINRENGLKKPNL